MPRSFTDDALVKTLDANAIRAARSLGRYRFTSRRHAMGFVKRNLKTLDDLPVFVMVYGYDADKPREFISMFARTSKISEGDRRAL
jgi:hypothetical protein